MVRASVSTFANAGSEATIAPPTAKTAKVNHPETRLLICIATLLDRKSTRLNSSHSSISYAVFCLKKKNKANPVFSIGLFNPYFQGIHTKEFCWPTNPIDLGEKCSLCRMKEQFTRRIHTLMQRVTS